MKIPTSNFQIPIKSHVPNAKARLGRIFRRPAEPERDEGVPRRGLAELTPVPVSIRWRGGQGGEVVRAIQPHPRSPSPPAVTARQRGESDVEGARGRGCRVWDFI